jgi:hypothetical protein
MIQRCRNSRNPYYVNYGGRGITICEEWREFRNFFRDMGHPPPGMMLERRDNSKGYSKENCCWATKKEQCRNMRRNRWLAINGEKKCLCDWAREIGISYQGLQKRIKRGWRPTELLERAVPHKGRILKSKRPNVLL